MRPTPDKGEGPAAKRRRMNQYQSEQCSDNKDSNEKDKTEYTGILVWEDQWLADSLPSERLPSLGVQYCCYHDGKGYYYHQTMEFGNIRYLACAEVMCPVKASMNTQKEAPITISGLRMGHNHRPDYMLREALLFVDAVRIRTRSGMSISSAISLEIVRNPAGAERVNLINLKNCLEECAMLSQSKNKDMAEDEVNFASCLIHVKTFKLTFSTESLIPVPNHFDSAICTLDDPVNKDDKGNQITGPCTPVENEEYRREAINIKTPCQNQAVEKEEIITVKIEENDCDEYIEEVYLKEERLEEIPGPSAPNENEEYCREAINIKTPCQNQAVEKEIITVKIEENDCDEYTDEVYLKEESLEEIPGPSAPNENEEYCREAINIKTPCQNQAVEKEIITVKIEENDCDEYTDEVYLKEESLEEIPGPSTPVENEENCRDDINKNTSCQNQAVEKEIITVKIEDNDSDEYTGEDYLKEERLEEYFEEEIITVKKEENDSDEYTGEAYLEEEKLEEIPGPSTPVENEEFHREDLNKKTHCQNQIVEKEIITVKIEDDDTDDSDEYTDEEYLEEEKLEEIPGPSTPVENEEYRREDLNKRTPCRNQDIEKEIISVKIEDNDTDDSDEYTDEVYLEEEKLEEIPGPSAPVGNEEYCREDINKKTPCQIQALEKEIITVKIEDNDSDEYMEEDYLEEENLEETALMKSQVGESRSRREINQVGLYPAEKLYSRNHGIIYYNGEGYYYKTNRTNENKWYLKCTEPKCMARGFIQLDKEDAPIIPSGNIHNHEPNYSKRDLLVFIHRCKERLAKELHSNVRYILESELARDGNVSPLIITNTYKKRLEAEMRRYRIAYTEVDDNKSEGPMKSQGGESRSRREMNQVGLYPAEKLYLCSGGINYYNGEGYYYKTHSLKKKNKLYVACTEPQCEARGFIQLDKEDSPIIPSGHIHNHEPDYSKRDLLVFIHRCKERAARELHLTVGDILESELERDEKVAGFYNKIDKSKIEAQMYKYRIEHAAVTHFMIEESQGIATESDDDNPEVPMKSQVGESRSRREMDQGGLYPAEKLDSSSHGIIYYDGKGHYYKTNRINENKWYLGCTEPKCKARGFIRVDKEDAPIIPSGHIHNHEPDYSKRDLLVFIQRCKERAARELHLNVRHILESELERDGNISALITKTYKKRLEAQMKRYRIAYGASPDEFPQPKATSVPKKVYRIGDFVYAEPKERGMDPILLNIQRLWTNHEGQQMLYGNQYYRPKETYHVTTRKFLEKEVFKTDQHVAIPLNQVLGRCCVLSVKDYFRSRPDNFEEKDVYVCESRYSSEARAFKKINVNNWPQSLTAGYKLLPRDQVLEPKRVMFVFREREKKHKEEIAELVERDKPVSITSQSLLEMIHGSWPGL